MTQRNREMFPHVTVVIVAWNQSYFTLECLSTLHNMQYPNFSIVIVDNASTDGTVEIVRNKFPDVVILENKENLGFAGGYNVGIRFALAQQSDYIFIINNDTEVAPDILDVLMIYAQQSGVGIISPKIYYLDEPDRIWSTGAMRHPLTYEMRNKGDNSVDCGQWDDVIARDYLVGCAMLMTRPLLLDVGLFDEGFYPAYYEDMDLCLRARQAGYHLLLVPQAKLWHKVSVTSGGENSPQERYLMARNSIRFFRKHIRGWRWIIVIPYRIGSAVKTVMRMFLQKRKESAISYLRGIKDGLSISTQEKGTHWTY